MMTESPDLAWKALSENFPLISSEEMGKVKPKLRCNGKLLF